MAESYRLSTRQTILLIELYQCHNALWDFTNPLYKDRNVKLKAYMAIQRAFREETGIYLPESIIKTKFHSFRTQFTKEQNLVEKSKKSGAQPQDIYVPKYEFFEYLLFLQPVIIKRPSKATLEALENRANAAQDEQSLQDTPDSKDGLQAVLLTDVEDSPDDSQASRPDMDGQLVRGQGVKRPSPGGQQGVQSQSAAAGQGVQTQSAGVQVHVAPAVLEQDDDERGVNGKRRKGDVCGKSFLDTLNDCLHDYTGREDRRKVETDRENTPNVLWAKNLALQIEEVRDEKKRKLLKLKITQMVNNCQMDELQNE